MNILVTGAKGFIGTNFVAELKNRGYSNIFEYDIEKNISDLELYCEKADIIYHLAGVNRPTDDSEFMKGNYGFTSILLDSLKKAQNFCPIVLTSSTQALLDNSYGRSKKAGEKLLIEFGNENNVKILIFRLTNVFGKWCKPNYNSAVATFCHNIANDLPIQVTNQNIELRLVYIDDVINDFICILENTELPKNTYREIDTIYNKKLGDIVELIKFFKQSRDSLIIPDMSDDFVKKLYSTYLSYLPQDQLCYSLLMNIDKRGSFTEFIKTKDSGQVSVNISKPGITKGNHWHHTKNEKFLVVSGRGVIRLRKINTDEAIEYYVDGEKLQVVDIPVGYTHNIENIGDEDMVTIIWVNEAYNPEKPDTFYLEVKK